MDQYINPKQAASLLNVTVQTVKGWADQGKIKCIRTPGNHRRYRLNDVQSIVEQRAILTDDQEAIAQRVFELIADYIDDRINV